MGLTDTVVASAPILSTWGNDIRDRTLQRFASYGELTSQWTAPGEGAQAYLADDKILMLFNGTSWTTITPRTASQAGSSTRTSTSYGDLADGSVPSISLRTGTKALVTLTGNINNSGGTAQVNMSYAVSGASAIAASDTNSLQQAGSAGAQQQASFTHLLTGLTAGLNTFTAKYRAASGTITSLARSITVVGIP